MVYHRIRVKQNSIFKEIIEAWKMWYLVINCVNRGNCFDGGNRGNSRNSGNCCNCAQFSLNDRKSNISLKEFSSLKNLVNRALTIKSQNIGASTKCFCKQMFNFDTLDSKK